MRSLARIIMIMPSIAVLLGVTGSTECCRFAISQARSTSTSSSQELLYR